MAIAESNTLPRFRCTKTVTLDIGQALHSEISDYAPSSEPHVEIGSNPCSRQQATAYPCSPAPSATPERAKNVPMLATRVMTAFSESLSWVATARRIHK